MAIPTRSPISPMSRRSPATPPHATRTGNWFAPEAPADPYGFRTRAVAGWLLALALAMLAASADARAVHSRYHRAEPQPKPRLLPYPTLELPLEVPNSQYVPIAWSEVTGWGSDDHLAAYKAFRISCQPIVAQNGPAP